MTQNKFSRIAPFAVGTALLAGASLAQAEITGNVSVVSQYIFRGGVEDSRTALQGGLDYAHESGFYLGTWYSTLDYSVEPGVTNNNEIDVYAGYSGSAGDFGYDVAILYFYYTGSGEDTAADVEDSDGNVPEAYVAGSYGPVGVSVSYALDDATWTNQGDTYFNVSFEQPLPQDFTFAANAGYYIYEKDGEFIAETSDSEDGGFRDATFTLSHPLAASGADMSISYTVAGDDRNGNSRDDAFWGGVSWTF
jgi:uncharacterized protein (TIGR02001 family)